MDEDVPMNEDVPCLLRTGGDVEKYQMFKLDRAEVSIGNSQEFTHAISLDDISPCHFVLSCRGTQWTIKDIKSLNGVDVNGHQLVPFTSYILREGDLVQFGASTFPSGPKQFEYKFCSSLKAVSSQQQKQAEELEEKKEKLEKKLLGDIQELQILLRNKVREQELLLRQTIAAQEESLAAKLQVLKAKGDVICNVTELMDENVQCVICTEYFIKATALNCSHVFCSLCIKQWMKVKKICPKCRAPVFSRVQIPALDNCIDSMIEQLWDVTKKKREDLLKERKIEEAQFDASNSGLSSALNALLRGGDRRAAIIAALQMTAAHTEVAVCTGVEAARRAAVQALTEAQVLSDEALQMTGAIAGAAVQTGARVLTRAKKYTKIALFTASAVIRRATALTRAAARTGAKVLTRSTVLRRAAALTRAAAVAGTKTLSRSAFLKRIVALAKSAVNNGSEMLTRSEATERAAELTKALARMVGGVLPRTSAMTNTLTRAAVSRAAALNRARTYAKLIQLMKAETLRKAAEVKKRAALIRASVASKVTTLKEAVASARSRAFAQAARAGRASSSLSAGAASAFSTTANRQASRSTSHGVGNTTADHSQGWSIGISLSFGIP